MMTIYLYIYIKIFGNTGAGVCNNNIMLSNQCYEPSPAIKFYCYMSVIYEKFMHPQAK